MESTVIRKPSEGRLGRMLCDFLGVLFGLVFLAASFYLLHGTIHYVESGGHTNSGVGCALGVGVLLFLSICLALPTKLYVDRRLRIAGQLAASMTSAATVASVVLPLIVMISLWISTPEPGDCAGIVAFFVVVIALATATVFLPCTWILARKAKIQLARLAVGTLAAGAVGALLIYLCH
jgi:hypothetical protein